MALGRHLRHVEDGWSTLPNNGMQFTPRRAAGSCLLPRWKSEIGDSHLFPPFPCLGFRFLGPTDWQGAQPATQSVFELAEE